MKRYIKADTNAIHYYMESDGTTWYSNGKFEYKTYDWNYDNDVYTMKVMTLVGATSGNKDWITVDEFRDRGFREISYQDVYDDLYDVANSWCPEFDTYEKYKNGKFITVDGYNWQDEDGFIHYSSKEDRDLYVKQKVERILKNCIDENFIK